MESMSSCDAVACVKRAQYKAGIAVAPGVQARKKSARIPPQSFHILYLLLTIGASLQEAAFERTIMDHGKLSWHITAQRKCAEQGKESIQVELMKAYRGDVVDLTNWGIVDKDAEAISAGVKVCIDEGEGELFKMTGPKTVYQVMDAILRTGRGDPMDYVYTAREKRGPTDCSLCPRQVFCGLQDLEKNDDEGLPCYKALWSEYHCHTGLSRTGAFVTPHWFTMERAVNNDKSKGRRRR